MEFENKKELKAMVTELYDRAVLEGKVEFSDKYEGLAGISLEAKPSILSGILGMKLDVNSGYMILWSKDMTRKKMIWIFTEFLWALINS